MVTRICTSSSQWLILRFTLRLLVIQVMHLGASLSSDSNVEEARSPVESPSMDPEPVLPLLAPSPYTNDVPNLSGKCPLNFTKAQSILTTTAIDCWGSLAPYLANVVCCPQLEATITVLLGQSSFSSRAFVLNDSQAKDCLSDITQILEAQGSNSHLLEICSMHPSNLTHASCPVVDLKEIENTMNITKIVESCERIDLVKECRNEVCQNAITDAAIKIAVKNYSVSDNVEVSLSQIHPNAIDDCKKIVLRWLASKLNPSHASKILRGISSCKINEVCPLVFPDMKNVTEKCGNRISNQPACCDAMENYIIQLQDQSFVTNLQALNCASSFASSLQKSGVSTNVYDICRVKLKDFSLQGGVGFDDDLVVEMPTCYTTVGSQDSGCLFPSLPFDVTYDQSLGIGFKCDLNDNVGAPWPSSHAYSQTPSSNISTELPALPKAASDQSGLRSDLFISTLLLLNLFI